MDLYKMIRSLLEDETNEAVGCITEFILSKGADFTVDPNENLIEFNWKSNYEYYDFSDEVSFYKFWIIKTALDQGEEIDMEDPYLSESFVNALLKNKRFEKLRKCVRNNTNKIQKVLDLSCDWESSALLVLDSITKYDFALPIKRVGIKDYMNYCTDRREEWIDVKEFDINEVLDQINVADYDAVIINDNPYEYEDDFPEYTQIVQKAKTLGFKQVIDVYKFYTE
jgi:hypothetical protein